jgi:hypothetical protein
MVLDTAASAVVSKLTLDQAQKSTPAALNTTMQASVAARLLR